MDKLEGQEIKEVNLTEGLTDADNGAYEADNNGIPAADLPDERGDEKEGEAQPIVPEDAPIDYKAIMEEDLRELRESFPELGRTSSITELENPMRYAALRDLGLTATEAYLATSGARRRDNRSHLSPAAPGGIGAARSNMTRSELERARELFPGLRDGELIGLYKKVNL